MADSVLGTILRGAFTADVPPGFPAAFAGFDVDDVREAFAALAEVGAPGLSLAAAAVAATPADDVADLLAAAEQVELPAIELPMTEPILAGTVESMDLDHRSLLEESPEPLDLEPDFVEPPTGEMVPDALDVVSELELEVEQTLDPDDLLVGDLDLSGEALPVDDDALDLTVDHAEEQVGDPDDGDSDEADGLF